MGMTGRSLCNIKSGNLQFCCIYSWCSSQKAHKHFFCHYYFSFFPFENMKRLTTREIEPPSQFAWCEPCEWREEHHRDDQSDNQCGVCMKKSSCLFVCLFFCHFDSRPFGGHQSAPDKFSPRFAEANIDMFRVSVGRLSSQSAEASVLIRQLSW